MHVKFELQDDKGDDIVCALVPAILVNPKDASPKENNKIDQTLRFKPLD